MIAHAKPDPTNRLVRSHVVVADSRRSDVRRVDGRSVLERTIAEHPGVAVAVACGVGLALGWLVKRKLK